MNTPRKLWKKIHINVYTHVLLHTVPILSQGVFEFFPEMGSNYLKVTSYFFGNDDGNEVTFVNR